MTAPVLAALALVTIVTALPASARASECGDFNGDCSITIRDAFVLLGRALDFNYELLCPYVEECGGAATAGGPIEDCFGDEYCEAAYPDRPYCNDHKCMACSSDEHCGDDRSCDYELERCMPNCFYLPPSSAFQHSGICGDTDDSGSISVTDALGVLKRAVGLAVELRCPASPSCTTTTTPNPPTTVIGDECFADQDCWDDYPGWYCGGSTGTECVECMHQGHCPSGLCAGWSCVPE